MSNILKSIKKILKRNKKVNYGYKHPNSYISDDIILYKPENLYMYERTTLQYGAIIMNSRAKFIMKRYSGAAFGLRVITGNHMRLKGKMYKQVTDKMKDEKDIGKRYDKDIIVEEDAWIGSNVTLLRGAHIGRGCNIGSGSVIRGEVPPYSVVIGNPAKVVKFVFTPEEIIEHEIALYPEEERIPKEILEKNYNKYFLKRQQEIKEFTRL